LTHPLVERAARGLLPAWAALGERRRCHVERVAGLLEDWAIGVGLPADERTRWVAAGYLHDALKGKPEPELRALLSDELRELPEPVLHGPAVGVMLRREGVEDGELLAAVTWHTLGHPDLGRTGYALYAADFLEPGRELKNEWRAALRARMPGEMDEVVKEIVAARIAFLLEGGRPLRKETVGFWNRMAEGQPWAGSSEL